MGVCVLFVTCCAMLYDVPLMLVVLCSCVLLKMCKLCVMYCVVLHAWF